jgi:quercetin dioxygenase-like cupin family protein
MPGQPTYELRVTLVEVAPGAFAEPHVHTAGGIGYVIDGSFESAYGDESPFFGRQGDSFVERANGVHRLFRNASATTPLRFVTAYALPRGAPVMLPATGARKEPSMSADGLPDEQAASATGAPTTGGAAGPVGIHRRVLGTQPIEGVPGWELRLLLVEYDPGVAADPHSHPVPGVGYVLDGAFESAWGSGDGGEVTVKHRGESFVDQANERHLFRNASRTEPLRFVIAYAIPKGAPALVPA